ncbi:metallophosphoesterase [Natronolimnohabitans innermongolicus]|uniref:Metallophosphoesterase n=1 Tax=Natronolimnohabitans innermongolicus JCM 12255 TaxID=1227499 RepID=L9XH86_9EURY|nr:metallophosphoesterase [Natronolimnohabitans innermongolicus]ELY60786.1 metallophosphoesterase [Natronolimnohabitans innermongolicus JCM 12255]
MTDVDLPVSPVERALYVPGADALVVADVHLGRAADSRIDAPIDDGTDVRERLADLLSRTAPRTVVVAGDLLHSFRRLPRGVEDDLAALEDCVADAGADLVVTPGNHDPLLESVFDGETAPAYRLADDETVVCHGHERPELDADADADVTRYVVGHDHPALSVDGRTVPCFLYGPNAYAGADVIVLPAFTTLAAGATVNGMRTRDFQSPLVTDADAFHPAVWDDSSGEPLWFPALGECRRLL